MKTQISARLALALVLTIVGSLVHALPPQIAAAAGATYFPSTTAIDIAGSIRTSAQTMAAYPRIGDLFFRLSTNSGEAQVVGYNRQMSIAPGATASLEIPSEISFSADYLAGIIASPISNESERRSFAGNYTVTSIGPSAFQTFRFQEDIDASRTIVYLDEVRFPDSLKVISSDAFNGQCALSNITIPDSVTHIGSSAFANMSKGYMPATSNCGNESGLNSFTLGTNVVDIGTNAFNAASNLSQLRFRGPVFPTRPDEFTHLPAGYELWGTSAPALLGGMEGQNSCLSRFTYTYHLTLGVVQNNSSGWISWATAGNCISATSISTIAYTPQSPNTPTASSPAAFEAALTFSEPDSLGGGEILEYEVLTVQTGATQSIGASTASPTTVTGLSPGTTYTFKIRARNSIGWSQFSPQSNPVTTLAVPSGIASPTASTGSTTEISLAFLAPSNLGGAPAILEYEIMVLPDGNTRSLGGSTTSPATISGLAPSTTYSFKIRARNLAGWSSYSGASNELMTLASATGLTAPTASSPTTHSLVLDFDPPSSDGGSAILEYEFKAYPSGLTISLSAVASAPFVFMGLSSSTEYAFTFRARNSNGWSLESSLSNLVTTLSIPGVAPQQNQPAGSPQAAYQGPMLNTTVGVCIPEGVTTSATIVGTRLSTIYAAEVDGSHVTILRVTDTSIDMQLPALRAGNYDVVYHSDFGRLTHIKSLNVCSETIKTVDSNASTSSTTTTSSLAAKVLIATATVYFTGDSAILTAKARQTLDSFAKLLKGKSKASVVIEGFVRRTAFTRSDMELSGRRAAAVVKYLTSKGLKAQFKPVPRGVYPEDSPRARKAVLRASHLER